MQYNDQDIRHTAFGAERRMPCGRTVQIFAPELDRQEQARLLGLIEIAEMENTRREREG